jgi:hypothetical protein
MSKRYPLNQPSTKRRKFERESGGESKLSLHSFRTEDADSTSEESGFVAPKPGGPRPSHGLMMRMTGSSHSPHLNNTTTITS